MSVMTLEQGLRKRLWVIDVPLQYQREFTTLVLRWVESSGEEWTIKRLKGLKVDLFRRRAGLSPLSWVRKNRRGDLAGCVGGLFRFADKSDKNFRKVVQTLMCYTMFIHSKPTDTQVKKFTEALRASPPQISGDFDSFFEGITRKFQVRTVDRTEEVSLLLYRGSPTKRKPQEACKSVPQDSNIRLDAEVILNSAWGRSLADSFPTLFEPVTRGLQVYSYRPIQNYNYSPAQVGNLGSEGIDPVQILGGRIAFLQEPGGKMRSVASPYLAYQLALRHFGRSVYDLAAILPWDCTHDQSKPIQVLQDALRRGSTIHSVDLSNATDYFPLEVQSRIMRCLFGNIPDIDLFEVLSRSTWISPIGPINWMRGQPLGLYPSFAVFAVTHGLLLWYLSGFKHSDSFFVLGDDVVILSDGLYQRYLETLKEWGCPYSPEKSLSSSQICEFAGKVITSESVTPQYKWREMSNDNFVDISRQLGHRSRILLTHRQQRVFDIIKHLMPPLGLNFSYAGSDRASMEALTLQAEKLVDKKVLESLVDQSRIVWKNLYGYPYKPSRLSHKETTVDVPYILTKIATFDEKVRRVLGSLLPWFKNENQDHRIYSTVPEGLGCSQLPSAILQPSKMTTLDRLERVFP